jgi:uncharacterized protein YndB with AHSA1/START domain
VIESERPKRLVLSWADPEDLTDESRVTFEIQQFDEITQLTVLHGQFKEGSAMEPKVAKGWPRVLSSLKSYLETGAGIDLARFKCAGQTT